MIVRSTVVGVFTDHLQAGEAIKELRRAGFRDDQMGVAMRRIEGPAEPPATGATAETAVRGAVTGGIVGGLLDALAAGLIPGIGPVIAGGLLAGILGGAALGAVAGGVLGSLTALDVPEADAQYYDREFQSGRLILTVRADGRSHEAAAILRRHGADTEPGPSESRLAP